LKAEAIYSSSGVVKELGELANVLEELVNKNKLFKVEKTLMLNRCLMLKHFSND
jgi:hypothetical protein